MRGFSAECSSGALPFYSQLARELGIWLHNRSKAVAVAPVMPTAPSSSHPEAA